MSKNTDNVFEVAAFLKENLSLPAVRKLPQDNIQQILLHAENLQHLGQRRSQQPPQGRQTRNSTRPPENYNPEWVVDSYKFRKAFDSARDYISGTIPTPARAPLPSPGVPSSSTRIQSPSTIPPPSTEIPQSAPRIPSSVPRIPTQLTRITSPLRTISLSPTGVFQPLRDLVNLWTQPQVTEPAPVELQTISPSPRHQPEDNLWLREPSRLYTPTQRPPVPTQTPLQATASPIEPTSAGILQNDDEGNTKPIVKLPLVTTTSPTSSVTDPVTALASDLASLTIHTHDTTVPDGNPTSSDNVDKQPHTPRISQPENQSTSVNTPPELIRQAQARRRQLLRDLQDETPSKPPAPPRTKTQRLYQAYCQEAPSQKTTVPDKDQPLQPLLQPNQPGQVSPSIPSHHSSPTTLSSSSTHDTMGDTGPSGSGGGSQGRPPAPPALPNVDEEGRRRIAEQVIALQMSFGLTPTTVNEFLTEVRDSQREQRIAAERKSQLDGFKVKDIGVFHPIWMNHMEQEI